MVRGYFLRHTSRKVLQSSDVSECGFVVGMAWNSRLYAKAMSRAFLTKFLFLGKLL